MVLLQLVLIRSSALVPMAPNLLDNRLYLFALSAHIRQVSKQSKLDEG